MIGFGVTIPALPRFKTTMSAARTPSMSKAKVPIATHFPALGERFSGAYEGRSCEIGVGVVTLGA